MTHIAPDSAALLDRLQELEPNGTVADVAPVSATDRDGRVEVTIDATRQILSARVLDLSRLRTAPSLSSALLGAFQSADAERITRSLGANDLLGRLPDPAEPPRLKVPRIGDVSYAAFLAGDFPGEGVRAPAGHVRGVSDNGYLVIERDRAGGLLTVRADEEWLVGTMPGHLEDAIVQAARYDLEGE